MRARSLALSVAFVAGLLAVPLPASAGPTTCPAPPQGAICIDESVEGAIPTIILSGTPPGTTYTITAVTPSVGEQWSITFSVPSNGAESAISLRANLLEPGSQSVSDAIVAGGDIIGDSLVLSGNLFSDNELGQIAGTCSLGSLCPSLTEDGTFQQIAGGFGTPAGFINFYLKSDLEVPEPASIVLFGTALVGFGVMRRRRERGMQAPGSMH